MPFDYCVKHDRYYAGVCGECDTNTTPQTTITIDNGIFYIAGSILISLLFAAFIVGTSFVSAN